MTRPEFLETVYAIAEKYGGSVTSGLRSVQRNARVGGHLRSRHRSGFALDVVLDEEKDNAEFTEACWRVGISVLDEGDHLHTQPTGAWGRVA
jgi:hypothetical protein